MSAADPKPVVPQSELVSAPLRIVLSTWRDVDATQAPDHELVARGPDLVAVAAVLTDQQQEAAELVKAITHSDPHALAALIILQERVASAAHILSRQCGELARASRWAELEPVARLTEATAFASRQAGQTVTALIALSRAQRHLENPHGALETTTNLVKLGETLGNRSVRSSGHDERARALVAAGRHDDALREFERSLELEDDPMGRYAILQARADAYRELGELRAAVAELSHVVDALDVPGASREQVAIALDNTAAAVAELGDRRKAAELLERAAGLLGPDASLVTRVINATRRADAFIEMDDREEAARAFAEAHELAFAWARSEIDREHYRNGFGIARAAAAQPPAEAGDLFLQGLQARDRGRAQQALAMWERAQKIARAADDHALALRIDANAAQLLARFGDLDRAVAIWRNVLRKTAERGLAQAEAMAWSGLATVAASGGDVALPAGPLGALVRAAVLLELQAAIVRDAGLEGPETRMAAFDNGSNENDLGIQARRRYALELARDHFSAAVERARELDLPLELANRLGNLLDVLDRLDRRAAEPVATELAGVLEREDLPPHGRIGAHKVLGEHAAERDPDAAIIHLAAARDAIEELRGTLEPGTARTEAMRNYHSVYRDLSRLLRQRGNAAGAFDAMQGLKGRRLLDALAARASGAPDVRDEATTAAEIQTLLAGTDTILVDLVVENDGIAAHLVSADTITSVVAPGAVTDAKHVEFGDVRERQRRLVELCLGDQLLARLAAEVEAAVPRRARLLIAPDLMLHNLPLHAVPVHGAPWCDQRRVGDIAAAGALRFAPGRRPVTGRAIVAGDSSASKPLPHAALECRDVAALLEVEPLVGPGKCTRDAVETALSDGDYDIVHLAVHGRGDARRGGRASLLLGEDEWVAFEELAALPWRAELVVFSGCSTAVSGPRNARDFLSVAGAAAEAGAAAVIACLWPVGDAAAAVFMRAFYGWLVPARREGPADLREALDVARTALREWLISRTHDPARLRDGREVAPEVAPADDGAAAADAVVANTVHWAPFVVLGDPTLGA